MRWTHYLTVFGSAALAIAPQLVPYFGKDVADALTALVTFGAAIGHLYAQPPSAAK